MVSERILFITGKLAVKRLNRVLDSMQPLSFTPEVRVLGVSVAALMTTEIIRRRIGDVAQIDRVIVPGLARCDLTALAAEFSVPFERGPPDLRDLPQYFGRARIAPDLSRHALTIFAEIVDASRLSIPDLLTRAAAHRHDGAEVIDLGCLPDTPFPHLEEAVRALKQAGHQVSVDSADIDELRRGGLAGADYLLSLTEDTLGLLDEVPATPILIPARPGDMDSLTRAIRRAEAKGRRFIADPILDPIHFGFTESLVRYHDVRRRFPKIEIMMGIGNLTELTDADTVGISALLMGVMSELNVTYALVVQVSNHCRRAIAELNAARRMVFAAHEAASLPKGIDGALLCLHEKRPFPATPAEIAETAAAITDPNFRVEISAEGLHIYNRDGHWQATDPFTLFPHLNMADDGAHAFYLGVETARAQIAWQLGKRYVQDQELRWGVAVEPPVVEDMTHHSAAGTTLQGKKRG